MPSPTPRRQGLVAALVALAAVVLAATAMALAALRGNGVDYPFRDVAELAAEGRHGPLAGAISQLGLLLWACAAGAALLGWSLLRGIRGAASGFLLGVAALSLVAALDDTYRGHEALLPRLAGTSLVYPFLYAGAAAALLWWGRDTWTATVPWVLVAALVALGASALVDDVHDALAPDTVDAAQTAAEDSLKLVGIALWAAFTLWTSALLVRTARPALALG